MKTKNSNMFAGVLIGIVVIILAGVIIMWLAGVFKGKRQDAYSATEKINTAISSESQFDLQAYDDKTISGDSLVALITEVVKKNPELSVAVQTLVNANKTTPVTIYYNKALTAAYAINTAGTVTTLDQSSKSSDNYITPSANFLGKVLKNANNEITGLLFIQQK